MPLTVDKKKSLIEQFRAHAGDTGSPEVQVALLTERINGGPFSIETGKVAKQADGAVVVRYGGTMVLATCVTAKTAKEAQDFFPLTVEYRERMYAGGRIPGGYFRREGAPSKKETLTCRLIDRPIRPLFPDGFRNEVQVICLAISADAQNDPDILAMNGASTALTLSGIPFNGPVGAVRVGLVAGQLVANPTKDQQAVSSLDLVIAGTEEAVLMVESGASEVPEETMLEAIAFGHAECRRLARLQVDLAARAGKPRWPFDPNAGRDPELEARVRTLTVPKLAAALATPEKHARAEAVSHVFDEVWGALALDESKRGQARAAFEAIEAAQVRRLIVERGVRGGTSATAPSPSVRSKRCCRRRRTSRTRSASCRTSSSRTGPPRWRRCAGPRSRSWMRACRSRRTSPASRWASSRTATKSGS